MLLPTLSTIMRGGRDASAGLATEDEGMRLVDTLGPVEFFSAFPEPMTA